MSGDSEEVPLTVEASSRAVTLSGNSIIKVCLKIALGLTFIIVPACVQDYYTVGGWLILMFLGIYLILNLLTQLLPSSPIEIKAGSRAVSFKPDREYVNLGVIGFLGFLMMILECNLGPFYWWPAGNVVGLIASIIVILAVAFRLTVKIFKIEVKAGTFTLANSSFQFGQVGLFNDVLSIVSSGWVGFANNEDCKKKMKQSRVLYFILSTFVLVLTVLVSAEEFILIKNWSCKLYAQRFIDGGLGYYTVSCNCEYWAAISALCSLIVLSFTVAAAYKPSWPISLVAGTFSMAYGIYMCLLSSHTVQSMMFLGNVTTVMTDNLPFDGPINRFLHLMPVQYIAVIFVIIGFSLWTNCFDLKPLENNSVILKILAILTMLIVSILAVVNMVLTQVNVYDQLRMHWKADSDSNSWYNKLPWQYRDAYGLYVASTISTSMLLLSCAMYKMINRCQVISGVLSWLAGLFQLGLAIFSIYAIFHSEPFYRPDSEQAPVLIILKEMPAVALALNLAVITVSGLVGIWNLIRNGLSLLQFLVWIFSLIALPFVAALGFGAGVARFERIDTVGERRDQPADVVETQSE